MQLKNLIEQHPLLAATAAAAWTWVWKAWEKELKAAFTNSYRWLKSFFHSSHNRDEELKRMKRLGADGLTSLLYLLLEDKDLECDRVTVVEYEESESGLVLATCLAEVRHGQMRSVLEQWQQTEVPPPIWQEILRVHQSPDRSRFVQDANTVDVALLRAAMLNSGVWSAYYQSLPTSTGKCQLILAVSWGKPHTLSHIARRALISSGIACATVWALMEEAKQAAKEAQKQ